MIPLTKTRQPEDFARLTTACSVVDPFIKGSTHSERRWEYAMAMDACAQWCIATHAAQGGPVADVGGSGTPFSDCFEYLTTGKMRPTLIDPAENTTLEAYDGAPFDVVFALSVLEHVPVVAPFLRACASHLNPGGLLVLTMDIWGCEGEDVAHFHWMRERIFTVASWKRVERTLKGVGMRRFGEADWIYHGDTVYGSYSFASLVMTKEP